MTRLLAFFSLVKYNEDSHLYSNESVVFHLQIAVYARSVPNPAFYPVTMVLPIAVL